jgi:hypothetical protein
LGRGGPFDAGREVLVNEVSNFQFLRNERGRLLVNEMSDFQFGGDEEGLSRRNRNGEKSRNRGNHERHQRHERETGITRFVRNME